VSCIPIASRGEKPPYFNEYMPWMAITIFIKSGQEPNVGSLAMIVSLTFSLLARNVSRKLLLFASPRATVCRLLQLGGDSQVSKLTKNTVTPVWSYVDCLNDLATCMSPLRTSQTFSLISSEILRISRQARLCASSLNGFSCSMYSR
jgi:hypothetical protein